MEENNSRQLLRTNSYCVVTINADHAVNYEPVTTNYAILAVCNRGSIDYELNMEQVHVEAGARICYQHVLQLRRVRQSADFEGRVLVLDGAFTFDAAEGIETNMLRAVVEHPVSPLPSDEALATLNHLLDALECYSQMPAGSVSRQVSMNLVRAALLIVAEQERQTRSGHSQHALYTVADTYFRNFINLVGEHVHSEHEVMFYAEHLHITPKYLSEICKLKTGRKAKEIISAFLLRSIKSDLLMSGKSMKILASEYGFADQSSLGKFFRKMTGLSPLHYKQFESGIKKKQADETQRQ